MFFEKIDRMFIRFILVCFLLLLVPMVNAEQSKNRIIILATTTSVYDTGLLDLLVAKFKDKTGYTVKPIAVGSAQALQMARAGEADILWVHSPDDELKFINEGYGIERVTFAHNDFVILGPPDDPAKIRDIKDAVGAFKKIAASKVLFISRGDNSGTHKKELKLWQEAKIKPEEENYIEAGRDMAASLIIANEKRAYVLADNSTYQCLRESIDLLILNEGDELLENPYSLILVNPKRHTKVNAKGARAFFDFILSKEAKDVIENYGSDKFKAPIFSYDYKVDR
jgi:tungstate transport system substrate-binding protein